MCPHDSSIEGSRDRGIEGQAHVLSDGGQRRVGRIQLGKGATGGVLEPATDQEEIRVGIDVRARRRATLREQRRPLLTSLQHRHRLGIAQAGGMGEQLAKRRGIRELGQRGVQWRIEREPFALGDLEREHGGDELGDGTNAQRGRGMEGLGSTKTPGARRGGEDDPVVDRDRNAGRDPSEIVELGAQGPDDRLVLRWRRMFAHADRTWIFPRGLIGHGRVRGRLVGSSSRRDGRGWLAGTCDQHQCHEARGDTRTHGASMPG